VEFAEPLARRNRRGASDGGQAAEPEAARKAEQLLERLKFEFADRYGEACA
jgi:hypothetical protein